MTFITLSILALFLQTPSGSYQGKHSRDSVKPIEVRMRDMPSSRETTIQQVKAIHAPLPEYPSDTLKKHQKLPIKPKKPIKKLKPLKGKLH